MSDEPVQLFVRTDKGATFGPLSPTSVELLIDHGVVTGRVQVSTDGQNYVFPGRLPGIRMIFPRELWGAVVEPGEALDAEWSRVVLPAAVSQQPMQSTPSGLSARPAGPVLAAGPGARALAQQRAPTAAPPPRVMPGAKAPVAAAPLSRPSQMAPAPVPPQFSHPSQVVAAPASVTPAFSPTPTPVLNQWPDLATDPNGGDGSAQASIDAATYAGDDIAPSGALTAISPMRLYYLAASGERTGLLTLTLPDRVLNLHFRKGTPEFVDSNHAEDGLALFLVKRQLLTAEVISQAEGQKARFGGDLLPTLFALGLLNPNTVFQHLGQRAADLLYRVLVAEQGTYTWQLKELSPTQSMPMGHKWSVFMEQLRRVPAAEVRRRMSSALDLPVMKGQGLVASTELKLSPQEMRALTHFDGTRSLNQLSTAMPAEAETLLRSAWVLQHCEVVSFAAAVLKNEPPRRPPQVVSSPSAGRPAVVAPAPSSVPGPPPSMVPGPAPSTAPGNPTSVVRPQTVSYPGNKPKPVPVVQNTVPQPVGAPAGPPKISPSIASSPSGYVSRPSQVIAAQVAASTQPSAIAETKQLTETLEVMKKQNFFEILGVPHEADTSLIKIAYFKLAKRYHPDTVPEGTPPMIAQLKADIFARVGDAHRTLGEPKLKADYAAELAAGGSGEKVDISKILAAEEFFQKGMILCKARKFADAVKMLTDAITASEGEGEYYAWRGWAKFFLYPDKKEGQVEAMKDIAICLKKNPNVASVYYFQGFMAKVLGDMSSAKTNFTKTVQLDPRHIDAQRELRMMK